MEGRSVLDFAEEYLSKGYSVIPIRPGDKKPLIKWQEYQERLASAAEIYSWFRKSGVEGASPNIAIVTGPISGLTVVDVDFRHGGSDSARTLGLTGGTVVTGGGGFHSYYRFSTVLSKSGAAYLPGVDIRSTGGFVLAPPSQTVGVYSFTTDVLPRNTDLPPVPESVLSGLSHGIKQGVNEPANLPRVSGKAGSLRGPINFDRAVSGCRNNVAAVVAGRILRQYDPNYERGYDVLELWNSSSCHPPLDSGELKQVYDSIWNKHHGKTFRTPYTP